MLTPEQQQAWLQKIYENIDTIYPSPKEMADKAASLINERIDKDLTHGELLAFSIHYLATMIQMMPDKKYELALKILASELLDFHYVSLLANLLEKTPDEFMTMNLIDLNTQLVEKIALRRAAQGSA